MLKEPLEKKWSESGVKKKNNKKINVNQVNGAYEPVSSHVTAIVFGNSVLVAVTGKRTPLCDTFVEVYETNATDVGHNVQVSGRV